MNAFDLQHVTAGYDGQQVLTDISCRFEKGERVVVIGPSGIGKTTLLRLLLGLKKPDSGTVQGAGVLRCGTVFQEDRLVESMTAQRNVSLVCKDAALVCRHLTAVGLSLQEQTKPVCQLSGGQRRRVALVRAILFRSDFLLLDEPFKGLDADTAILVKGYLVQNIGGRGLVLVTHDLTDAAFFDAKLLSLA